MAWPNPWVVGGADIGAENARLLAYGAFRGTSGVLGALDCRAQELETPGTAIRIAPGTLTVRARGAGSERQSYVGSLFEEDVLNIPPTGASGPRSHLVIVRVEDPNLAGVGQEPSYNHPLPGGPFMFTRLITDVPNTTNHVSQVRPDDNAETICRIDMPGGVGNETATVTDSMITDLRQISDLDGERIIVINNPAPEPTPAPPIAQTYFTEASISSGQDNLLSTHNTFRRWPDAADWDVPFPSHATGVDVYCTVVNPEQHAGHVFGETRMLFDPAGVWGAPTSGVPTPFNMDAISVSSPNRIPIFCVGTYVIPQRLRGRIVRVQMEGRQHPDVNTTGTLRAESGTYTWITMNFKRHPSYS